MPTPYPFTAARVERTPQHHVPVVHLATPTHYVTIQLGRECAPLTDAEAVSEALPSGLRVLQRYTAEVEAYVAGHDLPEALPERDTPEGNE